MKHLTKKSSACNQTRRKINQHNRKINKNDNNWDNNWAMIQWYVSWIRDFSKVIQEMTRSKRNPRVQDHWGSNRRCAHPASGRKQKGFFPVRWTALKKWWHGFVLKWKIYSRNSKNGCFMLFQPNENWSLKTGISYLATIPYKGCMTIQLIVKWKNPTTKPIVWSWVFTPNGETRSFPPSIVDAHTHGCNHRNPKIDLIAWM